MFEADLVGVGEGSELRDPCVEEEDVNPSVRAADILEELAHLCGVARIRLHHLSHPRQLLARRGHRVRVAPGRDHLCALGGEKPRRSQPDARRSTRDDCHLARQLAHVPLLSL